MVTFILAMISIPISSTILGFITLLLFGPINSKIQIGKKTLEELLLLENPGERLPFVSLIFSTIVNVLTKTGAFFIAQYIYQYYSSQMPVYFVIICGLMFIIHDFSRIGRFKGSSGLWTEIGYLLGDLFSIAIAIFVL